MIELLWFAAGAIATVVATRSLRRKAATDRASGAGTAIITGPTTTPLPERLEAAAVAPTAAAAAVPATNAPAPAAAPVAPPTEPLDPAFAFVPIARTLADELANLTSGIEGRAFQLVEAAGSNPRLVPPAGEALMGSIERLRLLQRKLHALADGHRQELGPAPVQAVVAAVGAGLQQLQLGLEFEWTPPQHLPALQADAAVVQDALLCLGTALLRLEPKARRLLAQAEACFDEEQPRVVIELLLECGSDHRPTPLAAGNRSAFEFDRRAAANLIASQGGTLHCEHEPGTVARGCVSLPAAAVAEPLPAAPAATAPAPAEIVAPPSLPPRRHAYGGALLLEGDPAIRSMLAGELKAAGRAVFACADGAAACSFLSATPERFELLFVDDPTRLGPGDELSAMVAARGAELKVCLVTATPSNVAAAKDLPTGPRWHQIRKPFGVHELRHALAAILAED